jgi:hypothetical protein
MTNHHLISEILLIRVTITAHKNIKRIENESHEC